METLNKVYISPYQEGYLMGAFDSLNSQVFKKQGLEELKVLNIFFNYLIQSGSKEIILSNFCRRGDRDSHMFKELSQNIKSRLKFLEFESQEVLNWGKIKNFLIESTKKKKFLKKENLKFIDSLSCDIGTMLFCADKNLSFCSPNIMDFPPNKIHSLFKEEVSIPLCSFFGSIKKTKSISSEPKFSINTRDVQIIEEILKSNYYDNLSKKYLALKNKNSDIQNILSEISELSKELKKNYDSRLILRNKIISTLDFSEDVISFFGPFTKSISNSIFSQIRKSISKERRLVIHDSRDFLMNLAQLRLENFVENLNKQHFKHPLWKIK